jgi:endonuclease/exonuclease/phosphatase (EEP) superfamily protein YafD
MKTDRVMNRTFLALTLSFAQVSTVALFLLSVAGHFGARHNLPELASHFKLQYLFAALVSVALCLIFRSWYWAAGALLVAALNAAVILPFYFGQPAPQPSSAGGARLKLVHVNVNYKNRSYDRLLDFAAREQPDVMVVQEATEAWVKGLQSLSQRLPFALSLPRDKGSGLLLLSRFPFERAELKLPEGDARPGLLVNIDAAETPVWLLTVHPRTPLRQKHFAARNAVLASAALSLQNLPAPKIFVGDLNVTLWSPHFQSFVAQTGLVNVRKGFGLLPSWPTFLPFGKLLMIPIDHCLVSDDIRVVQARTGADIGSDHLPLVVELELPPPKAKAAS